MGALGFGYNTELLAEKGLPEPKCWNDLIKPAYKGEVQIANPNSSGTSYTTLATIVQLLGEEAGFDYLKALHKNVNQYTKSGSAPIKAAARGETTIGIVFLHDAVTQAIKGFPIRPVAPCEGTGFEIGSMSIIKNARNIDSAKKFYDWALGEASQALMPQAKAYQVPSNAAVAPPPEAPNVSEIKLIDYDFAKYGSSAERTRLLAKWDAEVKSLPPVGDHPSGSQTRGGNPPPRMSSLMPGTNGRSARSGWRSGGIGIRNAEAAPRSSAPEHRPLRPEALPTPDSTHAPQPSQVRCSCLRVNGIDRDVAVWCGVGWIGFAILPWYGIYDGFWSFDLARRISTRQRRGAGLHPGPRPRPLVAPSHRAPPAGAALAVAEEPPWTRSSPIP